MIHVDDRSQERDSQGLVVTWGVEACEEIDIATSSTYLVDPFVIVPSSSTMVVDVCQDDNTHDAMYQEETDEDRTSYYIVVCIRVRKFRDTLWSGI